MNRLQQLFHAARNEDRPDCYKRVRYIRDCCKTFSDLSKNEKEFFNRSIDGDLSKSFREFRQSEVGKDYRMVEGFPSSNGSNSSISILNTIVDDLVEIHEFIDSKRRSSAEQIKRLVDLARDKQSSIRQTINELRDNYEKAERKLEIADSNLKKFQTRPDRLSINNYNERCRELEEIRFECENNRTLARDIYQSEIYQYASEEFAISTNIFGQYLNEQNQFYQEVAKYFSSKLPSIESRIDQSQFVPLFGYDLARHSSRRTGSSIAYPIEICVRLIESNIREEGIFRIASSQSKQKKFVNELNLQLIDRGQTLDELGYDVHVPANTLKQYLRELPSCLLNSEFFHQWNQAAQISDEQIRFQRVESLLHQLATPHLENLSYLVGFLVRLSKHSNETKMTVNNLSICIGSTILFTREQQQLSMSQASISTNYTNGAIILELLMNNYERLFRPSSINTNEKNVQTQPDLIPTEFHSKSRPMANNETSLEVPVNLMQPSPLARRKAKAPPPPPTNVNNKFDLVQQRSNENEENCRSTISNVQPTGVSSIHISLTSNDNKHRRTLSSGQGFDRPSAPPPLPPPLNSASIETNQNYENVCLPIDDRSSAEPKEEEQLDDDQQTNKYSEQDSSKSIVSIESLSVGQVIAQFNSRTSLQNSSSSRHRTTNEAAANRRSLSSTTPAGQDNNLQSRETTDF